MSSLFAIFFIGFIAFSNCLEDDTSVTIEKQRLIRFPDNDVQHQTLVESEETKRILEEINRININLGYVSKKKEPTKIPMVLNSEQYLYPRPVYQPAHLAYNNNGNGLLPSIRNLAPQQHIKNPYIKIVNLYSKFNYPSDKKRSKEILYYLPYANKEAHQFSNGNYNLENPTELQKNNESTIGNNNSLMEVLSHMYKLNWEGEVPSQFFERNSNTKQKLPLIFLPAKIISSENAPEVNGNKFIKQPKYERQRENTKVQAATKPLPLNYSTAGTSSSNKPFEVIKNRFGIFNKPPIIVGVSALSTAATTNKPVKIVQKPNPIITTSLKEKDTFDYDSSEISSEIDDPVEKNVFQRIKGGQALATQQQTQQQALKEGGIIIQRLRVREGGIAIAGPGGVASAGSGGTAIVGPGGLAFTHPRSLTIAGPGAKVISFPEEVDLAQAIKDSKARNSIPPGGKLVAFSASLLILFVLIVINSSDNNVVQLPYYGGAKGYILEIKKNPDGSLSSDIVKKEPSRQLRGVFEKNLHSIQEAAAHLVEIQESAKERGVFSQQEYADKLNQLGVAAQNLAKLQQENNHYDFRELFAGTPPIPRPQDLANKFDVNMQNVMKHEGLDLGAVDSDSYETNGPNKDTTISEAKPIGLSIAGVGGIAASKPIGTALTGPKGLAVSRPVGTAISGISLDEIAALGISIPSKYRNSLSNKQHQSDSQLKSIIEQNTGEQELSKIFSNSDNTFTSIADDIPMRNTKVNTKPDESSQEVLPVLRGPAPHGDYTNNQQAKAEIISQVPKFSFGYPYIAPNGRMAFLQQNNGGRNPVHHPHLMYFG